MNRKDARVMAQLLNPDDESLPEGIMVLGLRRASVNFRGLSRPAEVHNEEFRFGRVPDTELAERQRARAEWVRQHTSFSAAEQRSATPAQNPRRSQTEAMREDNRFLQDYLALLRAIREHPEASATDIYTHAGLTAGTGSNRKRELLEKEFIEETTGPSLPKGGRPPSILVITQLGEEFLNRANQRP